MRATNTTWPNAWSPTRLVEETIETARTWTVGAQNSLVHIISGNDRQEDSVTVKQRRWRSTLGKAFWLYFGWDERNGERHVRVVEDRLAKLRKRIDNGLTVKCRPGSGARSRLCSDGITAGFQQLGAAAADNINLCPRWFQYKTEKRASIIVHELMHGIGGPGTRDLRNSDNETVYGRGLALRFAEDEPHNARRNAENYEQFMMYRAHHFKLPTVYNSPWPGIPAHVDAAVTHSNGIAYFFKKDTYYRWRKGVGLEWTGKIGSDGWSGLPAHVEAALLHPNGKTYFFKYGYYFRYVPGIGVDKRGKTGVDGWWGLSGPVDAAFTHPVTGDAWFFQGIYAHKHDFGARRRTETHLISDVFPELYGHLDALIYYPPFNCLYGFVGDRVTRIPRGQLPT